MSINYLKNYKAKNPRALRLGLMATGLSLMKGAGQTYDKPVSMTGLMGEAGLQGLGAYEAARAADITSKEKGLKEAAEERRHVERIRSATGISEAEIGARESLAKYKIGKAAELSGADIAAAETRHLREYGPEGFRRWKAELESKTAGEKLSDVTKKREKEEGLKVYQAETERLFEPYIERDVEGEATLPAWLRKLYLEGNVIALDDPEKAQAFIREGIAKHEEDVETESYLESLSEMSLSELKRLREQSTTYPITRKSRLSEVR